MTKVNANICPNCLDLIFSRARHDFHRCTCGEVFIDGGFDYMRGGWKTDMPYHVAYEVEQSKNDLYKDYAIMTDQFGIIKDWKLSILDFFNVNDLRCTSAVKSYIEDRIWPKNFPVDHLTFPEHWENLLMSRILVSLSEKKNEENG